ncbi:LysR family transcriptional regulator [Labrenzia sp. PHM005]|uniref:LysR family transcriptional regulator n=1 Tax=Labrenzia sp. PHM005 TaxID=2590016 RepID=UPI00114082AB|nr:LysR family transcriptional regulator [Labrenzia sp. PHM005]QDG77240.1 LysR family transcriptional regulator [Labrenzia sp. PHM005]
MHSKFLSYFDEVARQGSIRRAAAVLHVSSSSVNRKILDIEERLGVRLFDRHAEGVELTTAGAVVLEHCRKTIFDYEKILHVVADIREMRAGHIDIASLDSVALSLLPSAIDQFARDYPDITYTIRTAQPDEIVRAVAEGEADIGISFSNDLHPGVRLQTEKSAPIGAILTKNHPLAERDALDLEDLTPFPLIRSYDALAERSLVNLALADHTIPLKTACFTNSLPLARSMILSGRGIGLYSKIGFLKEIESGELSYLPLKSSFLKDLKIGLLIPSRSNQKPIENALCRILSKSLRQLRLDS